MTDRGSRDEQVHDKTACADNASIVPEEYEPGYTEPSRNVRIAFVILMIIPFTFFVITLVFSVFLTLL